MSTGYHQRRNPLRSLFSRVATLAGLRAGDVEVAASGLTISGSTRKAQARFDDVANALDHGCVGDGTTDNSAALQALIDNYDYIYFPPGVYCYNTVLNLRSGVHIYGSRRRSTLKWTGSGSTSYNSPTLLLREQSVISDPSTFSTDVAIKSMRFECTNKRDITILAVNIRGIEVSDCAFYNCGGLRSAHERQINAAYDITSGAGVSDPAVTAGFSATLLDDLCEDVEFSNNYVNGVTYSVKACRIDFTRKFKISENTCLYASISWWGGAASNDAGGYGGKKEYLRRVCQGTISENYVAWANGGIYGNNGAFITIGKNNVEFIVDTGIDLEGCMYCTVSTNSSKYCGNFCYSIFYASKGNVFSNNIGVQGPLAANMNTQAGTAQFSPSLGRCLFKITSMFSDATINDVALDGNQFTWDGATGFGTIELGGYTISSIKKNTLTNVVVDGRITNKAEGVNFNDNTLYFSNVPSVANSVYVALACRNTSSRLAEAVGNTFYVSNETASTIILLMMTDCFNGLASVKADDNKIYSSTATNPLGYGDMRTRTGTPPKQAFEITRNKLKSGAIKNVGIISLTADGGFANTVVDVTNYTAALAALAVNTTPNTGLYASMAFGSAVL